MATEEHDDHWDPGFVDRRKMLGIIGAATGILGLGRCSSGGGSVAVASAASATPKVGATASPSPSISPTATATTGTSTSSCATTLEGEIGPYFTDDSATGYARSNIVANLDGTNAQTGVPLTLTVYVFDAKNGCAAYSGAQVDIWHCNASGIYSNESTEDSIGSTWLRGYQITDSTGKITFTTIMPGWYQGRTTHIHLRVRSAYSEASSTSDGTNTTQVFFAQSIIDYLATSVGPYNGEGVNSTTNASDRVYATQTKGENQLSLVGSPTGGYTATFSIGLPIGG